MAKGKHKSMAERRVEVFTSEATINTLAHTVSRLESEVARLMAANAEMKETQAETVRKLNSQIVENTGTEVLRLQEEGFNLQKTITTLNIEHKRIQAMQDKLWLGILRHLQAQGATHAVAMETVLSWTGNAPEGARLIMPENENPGFKKLNPQQQEALQKAQGIR